ncbi:MAG TPA: hypothetical protein VGB13_01270 [Candidatus Krumholzibacteria bacterium]|jgi:hypothetical protein
MGRSSVRGCLYLLSESALGGPLSQGLLEEIERGVLRAVGVAVD